MSARKVTAAAQDYLETILRLTRDKGAARVRDVATAMSVHKSTVSAALKNLARQGLVNHQPYELATLSNRGMRIAQEVSRYHDLIESFLTNVLLVDEAKARANACRMEHVIDRDVMRRLAEFAEQYGRSTPRHSTEDGEDST